MTVKPSIGRIVHYVSYGTPGGEYGQECRCPGGAERVEAGQLDWMRRQ